jgi:hypothetical protein
VPHSIVPGGQGITAQNGSVPLQKQSTSVTAPGRLLTGLLSEEIVAAEASVTDMRVATMKKSFIVYKLRNTQLSISQTSSMRKSLAH